MPSFWPPARLALIAVSILIGTGTHILWDSFTHPFSEVSPKIDNKLRRATEKQMYDQMLKDLRAKSKIEILMKEADFVVEPAPEETKPAETPKKP